jgi:hypothetical protein
LHRASDDLASNSDKSAELVKGSSLPNIPIEISTVVSESDKIQVMKEDKSNGGPSFVNRLYQIFKPKDVEPHAPADSNLDSSSNILEETPSRCSVFKVTFCSVNAFFTIRTFGKSVLVAVEHVGKVLRSTLLEAGLRAPNK